MKRERKYKKMKCKSLRNEERENNKRIKMNEILIKLKQKQWEINKKKKFEWMKLGNIEKSKSEKKVRF